MTNDEMQQKLIELERRITELEAVARPDGWIAKWYHELKAAVVQAADDIQKLAVIAHVHEGQASAPRPPLPPAPALN